jgi:hypothetical protein
MKGFIYITTNNITGRKYIGKKYYFYKNGKESNWKHYLGSSKLLLADIVKYGAENFTKEILEEGETEEHLAILEKKYIDSYYAVESDMFYNLSNSVDKFFTTPDSVSKGLLTRKKWSDEKKHIVSSKLKQRWKNMDNDVKVARNKKISDAHKNNIKFKQMRSNVQKAVWKNYTEEQKKHILEKKSIALKQRWISLTDEQRQEYIAKKSNALLKMNNTTKLKGEQEKNKWNNTVTKLINIKTNQEYIKPVSELAKEFNIPFHTLVVMLKTEMKITNKGYGKYNTYKRTWKVKPV